MSSGGLFRPPRLVKSAVLPAVAHGHVGVPGVKGGSTVASLVVGIAAGVDSIDDMAIFRRCGVALVFNHAYRPSTLGSSLRAFTFWHIPQLNAVAWRF